MKNIEFARLFGMSVQGLAEYVGLTRQALYYNNIGKRRLKAVADHLSMKSKMMLMEDQKKAEERAVEREKAIE